MNPTAVKNELSGGGRVIGTQIHEFATPGIIRLAAAGGADFLFIDLQHTGWTAETLKPLLATRGATDMTLVVRVATLDLHLVGQALDMGADGVMAPNVDSADEARRLVRYARYPPAGERGAAFGLAADNYRAPADIPARMDEANRNAILIALVESATGIKNVDAIAAVEGIDIVWLGQFDLTLSMGIAGDFQHPDFHKAVDKLVAACQKHGKAAAFTAGNLAEGKRMLERGFRFLSFGSDVGLYRAVLSSGISELRGV